MQTIWKIKSSDDLAAYELSQKADIPMVLARLLLQRGIHTSEMVEHFLHDDLSHLTDPFLLSGMSRAVERIHRAISAQEKIVIYGDYDVDGVTSIVIMLECLEYLGAVFEYYVPNRFEEGYGVNRDALQGLKDSGASLVITVDCGITAYEESAFCQANEVDLIITDHHMPGEVLPSAYAVINPKLDQIPALYQLAGAGVAFKLACALTKDQLSSDQYQEWLALTALATIADIVPLHEENRILVREGLPFIRNTKRPGLKLLLEQAGLNGERVQAQNLAFQIAPRLNSAGRLQSAEISVEALYLKDWEQAKLQVEKLQNLNEERKRIEREIFQEAVKLIETSPNLLQSPILIVAGENWHQGVIGIVASRLVGKYHKVTIVLSWDDDLGKASCRSVDPIDLYSLLSECSEYLISFGGHKKAAGLSMDRKHFSDFYRMINAYAEKHLAYPKEKIIFIDAELFSEKHNAAMVMSQLRQLEPFGEGNPEPRFLLRSVEASSALRVGPNGAHLRFRLQPGNISAIAFQFNSEFDLNLGGRRLDVVFEVGENIQANTRQLQYRVIDIKYSLDWNVHGFSMAEIDTHNAPIYLAIDKLLKKMLTGEAVAFIFPDLRSLQKTLPLLSIYFRSSSINVLHGHLNSQERTRTENILKRQQPALYLFTQAYLYFYLRMNALPGNLRDVLVWGLDEVKVLKNSPIQVTYLPCLTPDSSFKYDAVLTEHPLIYVNQPHTLNRLLKQQEFFTEVGEDNLHYRRELRELAGKSKGLLTDGVYPEEGFNNKFNQLVLADMPFTFLEMAALQVGWTERPPVYTINYSAEGLLINRSILNKTYPEIDKIKKVYAFLLENHVPSRSIDTIIQKLNQGSGKFTEHEFLSILHILGDLGLCEYKKNDSIIAIKVSRYGGQQLHLMDSVYYLEGLAAKKSLEDCAEFMEIR